MNSSSLSKVGWANRLDFFFSFLYVNYTFVADNLEMICTKKKTNSIND